MTKTLSKYSHVIGGRKQVNSTEGPVTPNDSGEIHLLYKLLPPSWSVSPDVRTCWIRGRPKRVFEERDNSSDNLPLSEECVFRCVSFSVC
jgi:hypothetical protein